MSDPVKEKGFGLIGLLIVVAIIALLFVGWKNGGGWFGSKANDVQEGQRAIDQAKNASQQENQTEIQIQNDQNSGVDVNYHGILNNLKK